MTKCMFAKGPGNTLIPADPKAEALVAALKLGEGLSFEVKRARNIRFHRLFFSLLQLAFDVWEPKGEKVWNGEPLSKNFDRFREDILILAGHYEASYSVDGFVKLRAKSISFASMGEDEFREVYRGVLDVVWEKVLREANFRSKEEVDQVVNQLLAYSG